MGRASAPQRRSQHHRPVISFKELSPFVLCSLSFVPALHKAQSNNCKALNTKSRNRRFVFFRVRIGEKTRFELVELPNFQISQIAHDRHVTQNFRALAQERMNEEAALPVDRGLLTVVIRSVKELAPRRI